MSIKTRPDWSRSVIHLEIAELNVRAVLKMNNSKPLLPDDKQAELEAICVILARCRIHIQNHNSH